MNFWTILMGVLSPFAFAKPVFFFNGRIVSSFSKEISKPATELLVDEGRVIEVGSRLKFPAGTQKINLKGRWIFPALTDAHIHLLATGREKKELNLRGKSLKEIEKLLKKEVQKNPAFISGFGWDHNLWPQKAFPSLDFLDSISKEIPIILFRIDGHAAWTNSQGLKKAGLWNSPADPEIPKGILVDIGLEKLQNLIPASSEEEMAQEIKSVVAEALSRGVTSAHDAGISPKEFRVLRKLIETENLPFRFYEMASTTDENALDEFLKMGPQIDLFNSRLTLRTVKVYLDGALGSRGALFEKPYDDSPSQKGIQIWPENKLEELIRKVDAKGFQVAVHAIGSRANEIAVSTFEKIWGPTTALRRPRIEHAQVLTENLITKMGQLGIVASMQPVHCSSDSPWVIDRIGMKRARYAYPWRSLLVAKVPLAFGTDSPIEEFTPWPGLFASLNRRFFPEEAISHRDAFFAFTEGAAFSAFQEGTLGSLSPGKWADFIIVDKNLLGLSPNELLNQKVLATYFAGTQVYPKK